MPKRSRVSRSDSFDEPNFPNKGSSIDANASTVVDAAAGGAANSSIGMTSAIGDQKQCFFCGTNFKKEENIYMYRSLAFCTEECRGVQIGFDEKMMKARLEAANKKGYN